MSIKYYQLAKDEEPPDEFCVIRDIGGEPSEYMFYAPEAENAKLREEFDKMDVWHSKELTAAMAENAKLRELTKEMFYSLLNVAGGRRIMTAGEAQNLMDRMEELGVELDG